MTSFKVGLLTLASIAAFTIVSFRLLKDGSNFGEYQEYRAILQDATGIYEKTPIRIAGIKSGRITSVHLDGNKALISFKIEDRLRIKSDGYIQARAVGFLGDKYLELNLGSKGEVLPGNSLISTKSASGFEALSEDAGAVLKDIREILGGFKESVTRKTKNGKTLVEDMLENFHQISVNLSESSASINRILKSNENRVGNILADLESSMELLRNEMDGNNGESIIAQLKKIGPLLEKFDEIAAGINNGEGTIGKLVKDETVVDELTSTLSEVRRIVNRANALKSEISVFTNVDTEQKNETTLGLDLYPSPERFYHVGVTTSAIGEPEKEKITTTTGTTSSVQEIEKRDLDTYRFNVQLGRKVQSWAFRGGLFESTGGVGIDYYLRNENARFSVEAFDYREDIGANLRVFSEFHLWNVIYSRAFAEELISDGLDPEFGVSAGLRFNDEDLRAILGLFF